MAGRIKRMVTALVLALVSLAAAAPASAGFEDNHNESLAADEG
jgi:hypothetical protein